MAKVSPEVKKEVSRLRSDIRKLAQSHEPKVKKDTNPFTGVVSGNYWTQTGMPWVSSEGRKAVLTEWFWQPIRGQPRRVDTNEIRQFSQTFWVNSCVTTICDEITAMDWDIKPIDEQMAQSLKTQTEEVKQFLKYPNKNRESWSIVLRALIKDILELDAGVLVKVFDLSSYDFDQLEPKSGAPVLKPLGQRKLLELYARDGASFLKEADKFGFVKGYWQYSYQIPAHPMWFNEEEIVYMVRNLRSMSVYGFSPVQSIMEIIKSLHYSTLYNKRLFEENSIPDGILGVEDTNENEMQDFVDNWAREFKGQPHKFAMVNKKINWQPLNVSQRELEFLETQKWYYKIVIAAFGLTPSELGITDELNRSTSATQSELSRRKGIRPLMKIIENYINQSIIPEFGYEGIEFQFVYDDPSEKAQRLANWKIELEMGVKTPDEIRNEMGLEPLMTGQGQFAQSPYASVTPGIGGTGELVGNDGNTGGLGHNTGGLGHSSGTGELTGQTDFNEEQPAKAESKRTLENEEPKLGQKLGKSVDTKPEVQAIQVAEEEKNRLVMDPFSQGNRPDASVKSTGSVIPCDISDEMIRGVAMKENIQFEELLQAVAVELSRVEARNNNETVIIGIALDNLKKDPNFYKNFMKSLSQSEKNEIIDLIYNKLKNDLYLILQRMGGHSRQEAAEVANLLGQRQRIKSVPENQVQKASEIDYNGRKIIVHQAFDLNVWIARVDEEDIKVEARSRKEVIEQAKAKLDKLSKGVDDGQYYKEPVSTPQKPAPVATQPTQEAKKKDKNNLTCPQCGSTTLVSEVDQLLGKHSQRYRCLNCHAYLKDEELMDVGVLNTIQATPKSEAVTKPNWSPKSIEKSMDMDMDTKTYVGFDYIKSLHESDMYAESKQYQKLLEGYFKDNKEPLSEKKIKSIIAILKEGIRTNSSASKISKEINKVIGDEQRSETIARTEMVRITNEGKIAQANSEGVTKFKWSSAAEDKRLCERCAKLDGKIFTEKAIKGKLPLHPRCRCSFVNVY